MNVSDVLQHKGSHVYSVNEDESLLETVSKLNEHRIGVLIVMGKGGKISGIVSERDVMHCLSSTGGTINGVTAADIMTPMKKLLVATPDDSLDYVMGIMSANRLRHLPVIANGNLAGLISIGDVVKNRLDEVDQRTKMMDGFIAGAQ